jgi:hypothetical protein
VGNQTLRKVTIPKPKAANLAKQIRVGALIACRAALAKLDYENDSSFAAAVQIAIAGAGFSAGELGRALSYDTGTIIKWYQGAMAPPRLVAREEVVEVIKALIERRLTEWQSARDSADGIRRISQRGRGGAPPLRWRAIETDAG